MQLRTLQNEFLQAFLEQNTASAFLKNIQKGQELSEQERLAIYQESITECLANALRETYPVCEKLVGDDFFSGMAYQYIEKNPSTSPNLFDYGDRFADFVFDFKPAQSLPYLSDVCRLEWAWHRAYYATNQRPMDFNLLANISTEHQADIIFKLPVGSTLLTSNFPIHRIWKTNQDMNQSESFIHLDEGAERLLIWRKNLDVNIEDLTEDEWQLLTEIAHHMKLGDVCEKNALASDIIALLPKFIEYGWIIGFEVG